MDAQAAERQVYASLIHELRDKMCSNTVDDECGLWWKHEDCLVISELIKTIKGKL